MYRKSEMRIISKLALTGILIVLILTSVMACSQNKLTVDRTTQATPTITAKTTPSPVPQTSPIVTIVTTNQPSRGSSNPTYEDNYLLFNNRSSNYLRLTCTLRQYDSQNYFKQDYKFDTIYHIPPYSYWAISTPLTQPVLQLCKIVDIHSEILSLEGALRQYSRFETVGEFTVESKTKLDSTIIGAVKNNSKTIPVGMVIQTFFYDQSEAIVAVRQFLVYTPYAPPGEKKQITATVNPVMPYVHTKTTIIARN